MTLTTAEAQEACKIASDKWAARTARAEAANARLKARIEALIALCDRALDKS